MRGALEWAHPSRRYHRPVLISAEIPLPPLDTAVWLKTVEASEDINLQGGDLYFAYAARGAGMPMTCTRPICRNDMIKEVA